MKKSAQKSKQSCCLSVGSSEIPYVLTRSRRRRTIQIAVKDSLEVNVSAPRYLSEAEVEGFVRQKSAWILRKLEEWRPHYESLKKQTYEDGQEFLFLGQKYPLRIREEDVPRPALDFENNEWTGVFPAGLEVKERGASIKTHLTAWYRLQAKEILGSRLFHFGRVMGLAPDKIVIKTQKNLWGSCSSHTRSIQLNWKLVLAPLAVIDYVVVHELSHLAVPNHSRRFWQKVAAVLPDYRQRQQWLKDHRYEMVLP